MTAGRAVSAGGPCVAKICGADVELGNFVVAARARRSPGDAASALLAAFDGVADGSGSAPRASWGAAALAPYLRGVSRWSSHGRKYLASNGGCAYIDLDHLEICLPEVASAWDHLACWHAMLRMARSAQQAANARLGGASIQVLVNNSDGLGASYGSHLDILVTRRAWDDMFHRRLHHLLFLAAYQASSIVFTGQGKVGSENGAPEARFQIAQRADFIETLVGPQTTYNRPLVNSRDEPLCGAPRAHRSGEGATGGLARLHVISCDSTLCHVAHLLKVGVLQLVVAMIEAERVNPALLLDDPVGAMRRWSHDPALQHRERLIAGGETTAVGLQRRFLDEARRFVDEGEADAVVPRAAEIVALWAETLARLEEGDMEALSGRLDWVLKLSILRAVLASRPDLSWTSPEIKHLDHAFSSLDCEEGLFWAYERGGHVERLVGQADVERFLSEPPPDTRAWTRAMLLRAAGPDRVSEVNWDLVRLRTSGAGWRAACRIDLDDPRTATRDANGALFDGRHSLEEIAAALAAGVGAHETKDDDQRGARDASA